MDNRHPCSIDIIWFVPTTDLIIVLISSGLNVRKFITSASIPTEDNSFAASKANSTPLECVTNMKCLPLNTIKINKTNINSNQKI